MNNELTAGKIDASGIIMIDPTLSEFSMKFLFLLSSGTSTDFNWKENCRFLKNYIIFRINQFVFTWTRVKFKSPSVIGKTKISGSVKLVIHKSPLFWRSIVAKLNSWKSCFYRWIDCNKISFFELPSFQLTIKLFSANVELVQIDNLSKIDAAWGFTLQPIFLYKTLASLNFWNSRKIFDILTIHQMDLYPTVSITSNFPCICFNCLSFSAITLEPSVATVPLSGVFKTSISTFIDSYDGKCNFSHSFWYW